MTFKQIAERMVESDLSENEIDEYRRYCASWMFTLNELMRKLNAAAAIWLTQHRSEYKSYAEAERAWEAEANGQEECSGGIHFFITRIEAEKYDV